MDFWTTLGVPKFADHWHIAAISGVAWHALYLGSRGVARALIPQYKTWSKMKQQDCGMRITSFVNAIALVVLAYPNLSDPALVSDKLFGYTHHAGNINAIIVGFFAWDTLISLARFDIGFILHGACCLIVYFLSYIPFVQYYGAVFVMFELSTPFLNIHWMCDKLGYTGSIFQLLNGIVLLVVFFSCRIVYGLYESFWLFVMMYDARERVPPVIGITYLVLNVILNALNLFWFAKMIDSIRRRFVGGRSGYTGDESGRSGVLKKTKEE